MNLLWIMLEIMILITKISIDKSSALRPWCGGAVRVIAMIGFVQRVGRDVVVEIAHVMRMSELLAVIPTHECGVVSGVLRSNRVVGRAGSSRVVQGRLEV